MRRLTRLTNAFSERVESLKAAVAWHFEWYNFVGFTGRYVSPDGCKHRRPRVGRFLRTTTVDFGRFPLDCCEGTDMPSGTSLTKVTIFPIVESKV